MHHFPLKTTVKCLVSLLSTAMAMASAPAFAGILPLVIKKVSIVAVAPIRHILGVGQAGVGILDSQNVLWSTGFDRYCGPGPYQSGSVQGTGANSQWQSYATSVAAADMNMGTRNSACNSGQPVYVLNTLGMLSTNGVVFSQNACSAVTSANWSTPAGGIKFVDWTTKPTLLYSDYSFWAIDANGGVWGAGNNYWGQMATPDVTAPCSATLFSNRGILSGAAHVYQIDPLQAPDTAALNAATVVLMLDGSLRAVGRADNGEWGFRTTQTYAQSASNTAQLGSRSWVASPVTLPPIQALWYGTTTMAAIPTMMLLQRDGVLTASGDKSVTFKTIGTGIASFVGADASSVYVLTKTNALVQISGAIAAPTLVTLAASVASVSLDEVGNLLVLLQNGTVYAKGPNAFGQLGLGHNVAVSTLTKVASNVIELKINGRAAALLKSDNSLWIAGYFNTPCPNMVTSTYTNACLGYTGWINSNVQHNISPGLNLNWTQLSLPQSPP